MLTPDLIVRSHRRSLSLTITRQGALIVRAPKRLPVDEIFKYIKEKEKWITAKQAEIQSKLMINRDIIKYNDVQFLGKKYPIKYTTSIKKIELANDCLIVPAKYSQDISIRLKLWFSACAKRILRERIEYFANVMQLDYASIKICNNKTRWGSCDSMRNIKLNFRLVMLPHKTLDFVLIHELAHIVEFNHSKDFYKIIQLLMPSYKLQQKILKENDYLLNLYR